MLVSECSCQYDFNSRHSCKPPAAHRNPQQMQSTSYAHCLTCLYHRFLVTPTGAQKDFGLAAYGERFAAAGLASFIFDYRTFGGSEGEPRHWVSPNRHLADWRSAVDFVTSQLGDKVDGSKLLLWGTSFGGGHALTTAARLGGNVTAVVAQVSWLGFQTAGSLNLPISCLYRCYPCTGMSSMALCSSALVSPADVGM